MAQWDSKHTSYHWAPSPAVFAARAAAARLAVVLYVQDLLQLLGYCAVLGAAAIQRAVSRSLA